MWFLELILPVIAILAFIVFKMSHNAKGIMFKLPLILSSTAFSLVVGHLAHGVMGVYGALFCDLLLYPCMLLIKKNYYWAEAGGYERLKEKIDPRNLRIKRVVMK